RCEVADRRVAPVVCELPLVQEALVCDVMDRQYLDRRHPELAEILERRLGRETRVCAAQVFADGGVQLRESLDVRLVDDGLRPWMRRRAVILPEEMRIDDDALRNCRGVVADVGHQVCVLAARRYVWEHVPAVPVD